MPQAGAEPVTPVADTGDPLETEPGADAFHRRLVVGVAAAVTAGLAQEATLQQVRDRLQSQVLAFTVETAELAGVDIFAAAAVAPRDGFLLVEYIGSAAAVLSLALTRSAVLRVGALNGDTGAINPDLWFSFTFPVRAGDSVNLRVSAPATVSAMLSFQDKS